MTRTIGVVGIVITLATVMAFVSLARPRDHLGVSTGDFPYRFERPARGTITKALEREIAFYRQRIGRHPGDGLDLAALAGTYLKMARATGDLSWYLLAEQAAQRSLANLRFHNDGAFLILARVAEARHDFHQAIRLAQQVGAREDATSIVITTNLATGRADVARTAAEALVEQSPSLGAWTLRGLVRAAQGDDDGAVRDFTQAIAVEEPGELGGSALARTHLGRLYARRGRPDVARRLYAETLRFLPQYPLALIHLAELEARAGDYAAAEHHLSHVVTITDQSPNVFDHAVLRGLARLSVLRGDRAGAEDIWRQAEQRLRRDVSEGSFGHRRELARLLLERARPADLAEALRLMDAEAGQRRDPETLDVLAWALSQAGRWAEARAVIREALRSGIRDGGLYYRAGGIERALGYPREAQRYFNAAREADPTFDEQARRVRGLIE